MSMYYIVRYLLHQLRSRLNLRWGACLRWWRITAKKEKSRPAQEDEWKRKIAEMDAQIERERSQTA